MTNSINQLNPVYQTNQEDEEIHLSDYIDIVVSHRKLIVLFVLITVFVTMVFTSTSIPVYKTSSKLVIGLNQNISPISGEVASVESYYAEEKNFNTHFKLITSKPVLKLAAQQIDMKSYFDQQYFQTLNPLVQYALKLKRTLRKIKKKAGIYFESFLPFTSKAAVKTSRDSLNQDYLELMSKITVRPLDDTRIMEIVVNDIHPERAQIIANKVAEQYIEFDRSTKLKYSTEKLTWMTNELFRVKKKLEDAEKEFMKYKQSQNMFSMEGKQIVINQKIAAFNENYLDARNRKLELDVKLKDLEAALGNGNNIMQIKPMVNEPIIKDLYTMLTTLEIKKGHLSKVFKSKHPKFIQINSEINNTRAKLKIELEKKLGSIRRERTIQANHEKEMKNQIAAFENEAMKANSKELNYNILQRNVDTNQQIYDVLLSQIKESNVLMAGNTSNLTIVEKADIPLEPYKPNKKRNFLLSLILGLFGGIGLSFFIEYLDQSIGNEESAEELLGYPVLTIVPDVQIPNTSKGSIQC